VCHATRADPKWKDAEKNALLGLRKTLNLAVNLRPAVVYPYLAHLSPLKGMCTPTRPLLVLQPR
jgi:isocitrate/isopropylmalate dehydrogenase